MNELQRKMIQWDPQVSHAILALSEDRFLDDLYVVLQANNPSNLYKKLTNSIQIQDLRREYHCFNLDLDTVVKFIEDITGVVYSSSDPILRGDAELVLTAVMISLKIYSERNFYRRLLTIFAKREDSAFGVISLCCQFLSEKPRLDWTTHGF